MLKSSLNLIVLVLLSMQLTAAEGVTVKILNARGKKIAETVLTHSSARKDFSKLPLGECSIVIMDDQKRTMIIRGDLNEDGLSDCFITAPDSTKLKSATHKERGPFLVIKEWGTTSRTIPCINEEDAHTKYSTAIRSGVKKEDVLVWSLRFTDGGCRIEVLSWSM